MKQSLAKLKQLQLIHYLPEAAHMVQLYIQGPQQADALQTAQPMQTHMVHHIHTAAHIQCLDRQVQLMDICKQAVYNLIQNIKQKELPQAVRKPVEVLF